VAAHSEKFVILDCIVLIGQQALSMMGQTEGRTDGQTDASVIAKMR